MQEGFRKLMHFSDISYITHCVNQLQKAANARPPMADSPKDMEWDDGKDNDAVHEANVEHAN